MVQNATIMAKKKVKKDGRQNGFSQRLKQLRVSKDLSQSELAELVGLRYAHIGRYERGLSDPSAEMLKKMAAALDVSTDYLLNGNEQAAAVADLKDKDLVNIFREVDQCSDDEKDFIKKVIDGLLVKTRIEHLSHSKAS